VPKTVLDGLKDAEDKSVIGHASQAVIRGGVMNAWSKFAAVTMVGCLSARSEAALDVLKRNGMGLP
jgi:hypothetical protein